MQRLVRQTQYVLTRDGASEYQLLKSWIQLEQCKRLCAQLSAACVEVIAIDERKAQAVIRAAESYLDCYAQRRQKQIKLRAVAAAFLAAKIGVEPYLRVDESHW